MAEGRFKNPVVATLTGTKDFFTKQKLASKYSEEDRAEGLNILITGANSGLGYALAVAFAKKGGNVIMAGRSRIPEAGEKVKAEAGSDRVEMRYLDLSKIETIHLFVDSLVRDKIQIDICVLNAATTLPRARKSDSGQDEMFQVNYLSNVILSQLLIKRQVLPLDRSPILSRLLFISSDSHRGASYIDYNEFGNFFDYGVSKAISNYSYFKLVLNTYATELSRRINASDTRLSVNAICPGPVNSNIVKEAPWVLRMILKGIFTLVFKSPAKAARPVVYMALSGDYANTTNEYLHMFNPRKMDSKVYEAAEGQKLWDASMELLQKIDPGARDYLS